ncbi:MAG: hypothetical protein ACE5QF_01915 [Thermoplasmata archaeon]
MSKSVRRLRFHQVAAVLFAGLLLATAISVTCQSPLSMTSSPLSPGGDLLFGGNLENFSLSASFLASLQAADGGIKEAEDNNYKNTDNTLEAIWVWCRNYRATGDNSHYQNVLLAWNYSVSHPAWTETDSGRVYSSAWALLAEREYRQAYGKTDMVWYANQSATYIINRKGWEEPIFPSFDVTVKRHIMGWGAGALYKWATQLGNSSAAQEALSIGNLLKIAVENDSTLLSNESWALAGGASFWGIATTVLAESPNASWIETYAPLMKTEVTNPGSGPGNSQNGWEAWYALGWWAAYNATENQTFLDNYQSITVRLISRDGDRDGGVPTNVGDPDDTDESWVTAYRAYFCLRQGIKLYDLRPPHPPEITGIVSDASNVTLTWNLSADDGAGTGDVLAYEIHSSEAFNSSGSGYQLLATLGNGTSSYVHVGAGSDAKTHFYFVVARDYENFTSRSMQAVKFSKVLPAGQNLVSFPLLDGDVPIQNALAGIEYDLVRAFSGSANRPWLLYSPDRSYGDLKWVNATSAVWVRVTAPSELVTTGLVPTTTVINFRSGWNLVGFTSFRTDYTVSRLKSELSVLQIESYSGTQLPYHLDVLQDSDPLLAGNGYWVNTDAGGTITIGV